MKLTAAESLARLVANDHGTLSTIHPELGIQAVPVVYAIDGDVVGIPIDTVKPKNSGTLQRESNTSADPRATLLIEHWDRADWSKLWWARDSLEAIDSPKTTALADSLATQFSQYADKPFARIMTFRIVATTGWSAT